jgi:hypothetical protein
MGFRTLAVQKRSSEVWNLLGAGVRVVRHLVKGRRGVDSRLALPTYPIVSVVVAAAV